MIDPLTTVYESINIENPHIEYPLTIDSILKTDYLMVDLINDPRPKDPLNTKYVLVKKSYFHGNEYTWFTHGKQGRDEKDEKTKLYLPTYVKTTTDGKTVLMLTWTYGRFHDRRDTDPKTGLPLPQYSRFDQNRVEHEYWVRDQEHNLYGPAKILTKLNVYTNHRTTEEYWIEGKHMSKEEWEKDPRVLRIKNIQKIEDKDIADDDFLRGFGEIL